MLDSITLHLLKLDFKNKNLDHEVADLVYSLSIEDKDDIHLRAFLNKEEKIIDPISNSLNLKFGMIGVNDNYEVYTEYVFKKYSDFVRESVYKRLVDDLEINELINLKKMINQEDFVLPNVRILEIYCHKKIEKNKYYTKRKI